nr:dTMP kinase [Spirulina major]
MMSGQFIVFEGGEGAGKTTQLRRSHAWLKAQWGQQRAILQTREPGGTPLGSKLRDILLHSGAVVDRAELLLFAADRAQHVDTVIQPALSQGAMVLCDRFTDSTWAYQGYGRGLDLTLIAQLNAIATHHLTPHLTFWLDLPVEVGLARSQREGQRDRIEQADLSFHRRVREGFTHLVQQEPERIVRIDASQPADQVQQAIQTVLRSRGYVPPESSD